MLTLLLYFVIALVVVGLVLWIVTLLPIDETIKKIIRVVVIVFICLWLLYVVIGFLPSGGLPPLRR